MTKDPYYLRSRETVLEKIEANSATQTRHGNYNSCVYVAHFSIVAPISPGTPDDFITRAGARPAAAISRTHAMPEYCAPLSHATRSLLARTVCIQ